MFTRVEESWENPGSIDHEKSWDLRPGSWTKGRGWCLNFLGAPMIL
jgi:hypothetical protein